MADPTLKELLEAIARIERNAATKSDLAAVATKSDLAKLEAKLATKGESAHLESKMNVRFDRLEKRFDDLI
jgi:hypothetical protein